MAASDRVLLYHYRARGSPVVKDGLAMVTNRELTDIMKQHPELQQSSKAIDWGARKVAIFQRDLLTSQQASAHAHYPNYEAHVAGIKVPLRVMLGRALTGAYPALIILSKRCGD